MPLRYIDPNRPRTWLLRVLESLSRSWLGQLIGKYVASKMDPWLSRISNGRVSWGMFNMPSATLNMTGAKTGQPRAAQIAYFHDGNDVIAVASNYGGNRHPQWYYNLVAHPECELGDEVFRATEVSDPLEYERLYGLAERYYAGFADYKAKTGVIGRKIPVFRLSPITGKTAREQW